MNELHVKLNFEVMFSLKCDSWYCSSVEGGGACILLTEKSYFEKS